MSGLLVISPLRLPELGRDPGRGFPLPRSLLLGSCTLLVLTLGAAALVLPAGQGAAAVTMTGRIERATRVRFTLPPGTSRRLTPGESLILRLATNPAEEGRRVRGRVAEAAPVQSPEGPTTTEVVVALDGPERWDFPPGAMLTVELPAGPNVGMGGMVQRLQSRLLR